MKVKKCLGVYLSEKSFSLAHVEVSGNGYKSDLLHWEKVSLSIDEPEDVRFAFFAKRIKEVLKEKKISTKNAVFAISGMNVFNRKRKLPNVPDRQLKGIVRYEAFQIIPFPPSQIQLEFCANRTLGEPDSDVWIMAIKKDAILAFIQKVKKIGLNILKLEVSSVSLFNLGVADEKELAEDEMIAFVNLGLSSIDISIGNADGLGFTRSAPEAGNEIAKALAKKMEISFSEAEEIRDNRIYACLDGLQEQEVPEGYDQNASIHAKHVLERMVADIRRSIDFYISQPDGMAVETIVLSGSLTRIPFLKEMVEERLGVPVLIKNELNNIETSCSPDQVNTSYLALSLAYAGVSDCAVEIDFLPPALKDLRNLVEHKLKVAVAAVLMLVNIGVASMVGGPQIQKYTTEINSMRSSISQGKSMAEKYDNALNSMKDVSNIVKFINKYKLATAKVEERSDFPLQLLKVINQSIPVDAMWIETFRVNPEQRATLIVNTIDNDSFWKFFDALKALSVIDVEITVTRDAESKELGRKVMRNTLIITLPQAKTEEAVVQGR